MENMIHKKIYIINNILFILINSILFLPTSNIYAQEEGRSKDIKLILEKIASNDPISGPVAVDEAFKSEDPVLKSIVLEKSLQSKDRRIRDAGFRYIASKIKEITVEISVTDKDIEEINNIDKKLHINPRGNNIIQSKTIRLKIENIDENGNLKGTSNKNGSFAGSIGSGDLSIIFFNAWNDCGLKFKNFDSGYLNGSFSCSGYSFAAKAILP